MADIVQIGIAYDTSALMTGSRQVQGAMQQLVQAERQAQSASETLARSSTQTAQALHQESQAASRTSQGMQQASQSTRGLAQQEQALAQATGQASQALQRSGQAAAQAGQATQALGGHARTLQGTFQSLVQSMGAFVVASASLHALRSTMEGIVQTTLKLDALTLGLKAITGSAQGAADAMAFLRATGERLGVQVDAISGGYRTLLAATKGTNLSLKDTQTVFLGIVEGSRALGLSAEDTAGALRPLTQIIGQQAFQADELRNELGARLPVALQLLVTASNGAVKSTSELFKAMEDGKLKGQVALDLVANFGVVLRQHFAPAAAEAAKSAAAAFERMKQAVTDLQVALGTALLPALADVARAMTELLRTSNGAASAFGQSFTVVIREAASAVVGLAGGVAVLAKAMALLRTPLDDPAAILARWNALKDTFLDVATAQHQILNPAQLTQLNPKLPPLPGETGALRPITLGSGEDEKKTRGKTEAEKEANRVLQEQKSLREGINDAYEKALHTEREYTELQLKRAGFGEQARAALMTRYDETQILKEITDEEKQRTDLAKELNDAYDKARLSERELLELKLQTLKASQEDTAEMLKKFDATEKLKKAAEERKKAEEDAVQATKEQASEIERLMKQLEPRRRNIPRQQQLQNTVSELSDVTSDPYTLQRGSNQMQETLAWEKQQEQLEQLEALGTRVFDHLTDAVEEFVQTGKFSFKGMIDAMLADFMRFSMQSLTKMATESTWWQSLMQSATSLLGSTGTMSTGTGGAGTTPNTAFTTSIGGNAPLMQHGGPAYANHPYIVGDAGPELFVPRTNGAIVPNGTPLPSSGGNVAVTVVTPDYDSFRRSRSQVAVDMSRAFKQARRVA